MVKLNIIILNNRPNTQLAHIISIPRLILNTFEYITQYLKDLEPF